MSVIIPTTSNSSSYRESVQLDTNTYIFEFNWLTEQSVWMMSLYTDQEEPIVLNETVKINDFMFSQYVDDRLPQGAVTTIDRDNDPSNPIGRYDLGSRIQVVFVPVLELIDSFAQASEV